MKDREPEHNESTDEAAWLDLVARLEEMPADETHGGRTAPGGRSPDDVGPAGKASDRGPGSPSPGTSADAGDGSPRHGADTANGAGSDPAGAAAPGADAGPASPRSAADRTRAIFENQPLRAQPPRGPRDYDEPEELESEGEFVPPEPPPFSTGEPLVILAWLGALGGPVLLLLFAMFWRGAPLAIVLGVIALFVASAGYLLFRLPQQHDDDGAAV